MKSVVVLGMHRSGTSMVASVIEALGVNMGDDLLPPGHGNPLGFYEDVEFMRLNDKILRTAGGNWAEPPARYMIIDAGDKYQAEIDDLIAKREHRGVMWGWKDPRTALTADLFLPKLLDPMLVFVRRNRRDIIRSLIARKDPYFFDEKLAGLIADEYEDRINRLRRLGMRMLDVSYELTVLHPEESTRRISRFLGLDPKQEAWERIKRKESHVGIEPEGLVPREGNR